VVDFLDAINHCRTSFMGATDPWPRDDVQARAMFAYLTSLPGGVTDAIPFTVVQSVKVPPAGDPALGKSVYDRACLECHGERSTGNGKRAPRAPAIPEQTLAEHTYVPVAQRGEVFVEKIRHGVFLGYSGTMPPFSLEAMSDGELGALFAYMGGIYP